MYLDFRRMKSFTLEELLWVRIPHNATVRHLQSDKVFPSQKAGWKSLTVELSNKWCYCCRWDFRYITWTSLRTATSVLLQKWELVLHKLIFSFIHIHASNTAYRGFWQHDEATFGTKRPVKPLRYFYVSMTASHHSCPCPKLWSVAQGVANWQWLVPSLKPR